MKKRLISTAVLLLVCLTMVISCSEIEYLLNIGRGNGNIPGDEAPGSSTIGSEPPGNEEPGEPVSPDDSSVLNVHTLSELELNILHYEILVNTDGSVENFSKLADLYNDAEMIRKQRDTLERSYRLNQDPETFEELQKIVVNFYEENSLVQENIWNLREYIREENNQPKAINLVMSDEWFVSMMPNITEGKRSYYLEDTNDWSILLVEVGYDVLNKNTPYTRVWYHMPEANGVIYMFQSGNMFQIMHTGITEGLFDGDFDLWLCVVNSNTIYQDKDNN